MSVITSQSAPTFGLPTLPIRRFSVNEYHQMIRAGILTEDDPVELLEGWIVHKMPRNPPHDGTIQKAGKRLGSVLPPNWDTRIQLTITTTDSQPEPDLAIVQGDADAYMTRHPVPADIALVIEVADSSLQRDRDVKGRIYARAGIVYYWIINLIDRQIEEYSGPSGPVANARYNQRRDYGENDTVPLLLGGKLAAQVPVRELLP